MLAITFYDETMHGCELRQGVERSEAKQREQSIHNTTNRHEAITMLIIMIMKIIQFKVVQRIQSRPA